MSRPTPAGRPSPRPRPSPVARRPLPGPSPAAPAGFLARHRGAARAGALGAIAAGTALFVVVSVLTPGAGAQPERPPASASAPMRAALAAPADPDPLQYASTSAPKTTAETTARKRHAVDTAAISGLAANGIPATALNAYRVAAARMANVDPGCGIDWAMLAGIGRVESDHGRFGGAVLHTDGTSSPEIVGPALNGHGTALIPAPANGVELDGDPLYTHALGPMQFIPQTWAGYGADADNDGQANIFDIDDAALGAARYLCAAGGDLRTHDGQVRAVLAYNHVMWYVNEVLALADAYRRGVPISGIPIGQLTGALPPVKKTGTPANPGPPTAVGHKHKATTTKTGHPSSGGSTTAPSPSSSSRPPSSTSHSSAPASTSSRPSSSAGSTPPPSSSSSSSSSPTPSPTGTCRLQVGGTCVVK